MCMPQLNMEHGILRACIQGCPTAIRHCPWLCSEAVQVTEPNMHTSSALTPLLQTAAGAAWSTAVPFNFQPLIHPDEDRNAFWKCDILNTERPDKEALVALMTTAGQTKVIQGHARSTRNEICDLCPSRCLPGEPLSSPGHNTRIITPVFTRPCPLRSWRVRWAN